MSKNQEKKIEDYLIGAQIFEDMVTKYEGSNSWLRFIIHIYPFEFVANYVVWKSNRKLKQYYRYIGGVEAFKRQCKKF